MVRENIITTYYSTNDHDSVEHIPTEYDTIAKKIEDIVHHIVDHGMKQVLVVKTSENKIYENIIDHSSDATLEEQKLLDAIGENSNVTLIVCCWFGGTFDMPSYHFRKKLCELNENNEKAHMLLSGENRYILKSIKETFGKG